MESFEIQITLLIHYKIFMFEGKNIFSIVSLALAMGLVITGCSWGGEDVTDTSANQENAPEEDSESSESKEPEILPTPDVPDGAVSYQVNTIDSEMQWHGERLLGKEHTGMVQITKGEVFEYEELLIAGNFVIDMTTIEENENNETLENHLKSGDFFDVEKYPTSEFVITKVEKEDDDTTDANFLITGNLTIKGTTQAIIFSTKVTKENDSYSAHAEFTIDRTRWGIEYDSGTIFSTLGNKAIDDEIDFVLDLSAQKS